MFADSAGIIPRAPIEAVVIAAVRPERVEPKAGMAIVVGPGIGSGGVTAHINSVAALPIVGRTMTGSQGRGDENEVYVFCFFHFTVMNI